MPGYLTPRRPRKRKTVRTSTDRLCQAYRSAKALVRSAGYSHEAEWQADLDFAAFTEPDLLRETAWVILCSGFRESVVRRVFGYISLCFCDWASAAEITSKSDLCRATALRALKHAGKIDAIVRVAEYVAKAGFAKVKQRIIDDPLSELMSFPYVGPTTTYHLAKNLGLPIAKPDRHLVRMARSAGFGDVQEFCGVVAGATGDPVPVVDIVLWRFATLSKAYVAIFEVACGRALLGPEATVAA